MNEVSDRCGALARALGLAGALAIILGAKLWLISVYGTSTPFWDQWVEPNQIYRPYLTGGLNLSGLIAPHNEHRILLTRLIALGLFAAEGRWDPIAQALVNALIQVTAIGIFIVMLTRTLDLTRMLLLAVLAALLFALPFGWGNTLIGFQSQFYLLALLGPLSLWLLYGGAAWSARWLLGTLIGALSYFTMASGALTFPAFIVIAVIQFVSGWRRGRGEILGLILHLVLAVAFLMDIPKVPSAEETAATSLPDWLSAIAMVASWPVAKPSWPLTARALTALGLYLPLLALVFHLIRRPAPLRDQGWFIAAVACWTALQMLALIYGRGQAVLQSRYFDLLLLAPLATAAALFYLRSERWPGTTVFACAWFAAIIIGIGQKAFDDIPAELAWRSETAQAQTRNLKNYIATGDFAALENKPKFDVPYPDPGYLRDTVSNPVIRAILPPDLVGEPEPPNKLKGVALRQGRLLLPIGLALMVIAVLLGTARRERAG
jgi:hypothetical protein